MVLRLDLGHIAWHAAIVWFLEQNFLSPTELKEV